MTRIRSLRLANRNLDSPVSGLGDTAGCFYYEVSLPVRLNKEIRAIHAARAKNFGHAIRTPQAELII
jgi:hypothetical protein